MVKILLIMKWVHWPDTLTVRRTHIAQHSSVHGRFFHANVEVDTIEALNRWCTGVGQHCRQIALAMILLEQFILVLHKLCINGHCYDHPCFHVNCIHFVMRIMHRASVVNNIDFVFFCIIIFFYEKNTFDRF